MSENSRQQVRRLFLVLADLPEAERQEALNRACVGDSLLRNDLEALLRADRDAGAFLANPTGAVPLVMPARTDQSWAEQPGLMIGRYKLLERIGEGGFGSVWLAEQREPVKRRVALKVIKLGMDTKQVIARFEAERQALAMMDHPHIAKVLDAGATDAGRPFFVMELVKGVPILEYCDRERLDATARLQLFTSVCHAIQHAHQKGIIHRDIKPSNILVTLHDGIPIPKVIDFGIAKATNSELTSKTLFTEHRQIIGTPAYMSPEQAEMSGLDVDTRSDIYSLGVLLYELLTGTTPFRRDILAVGLDEMLRVIREVEPQKPSLRISSLGDTAARTAEQRLVDVRKLGAILRGDLDWIVMKCLEKDRSRRYDTANGLAADIQRHLDDEPVTAGPPSTAYKLRKFVRRNRAKVVAGGIVIAALVLGVVGATTGMMRALDEKQRADEEAGKALVAAGSEAKAKVTAQENEQRAVLEAQRAEAAQAKEAVARRRAETISEFVTTALMASDAQNTGGGQDMTILAAMDNAIADIASGRFRADLETEAELQDTIGTILLNNGRLAEAEPLFVRALKTRQQIHSSDHVDVAESLQNVVEVWRQLDRASAAEPLQVQALEMTQRLYEGDHPEVARALCHLALVRQELGRASEAEPQMLSALAMYQRMIEGDSPHQARLLGNLASIQRALGRGAQAEEVLRLRSLEMCQRLHQGDHPDIAISLNNLASVRAALGRMAEAEALYVQSLEMSQRLYRGDHRLVAVGLASLASARRDLGRLAEAEPLYLRALEMRARLFVGDHPHVAQVMDDLAVVRRLLGRAAEAETLQVQSLEMWQRLSKGDRSEVASCSSNLGLLWQSLGRAEAAEPLFVQSLAMFQRLLGADHQDVAASLSNLANVNRDLGRMPEAEALFVQSLAMYARVSTGDHENVSGTLGNLARARQSMGKTAEARQSFDEAVAMARRLSPTGSTLLAQMLWHSGSARLETDGAVAALPELDDALRMGESVLPAGHVRLEAYRETLRKCRSLLSAPRESSASTAGGGRQ